MGPPNMVTSKSFQDSFFCPVHLWLPPCPEHGCLCYHTPNPSSSHLRTELSCGPAYRRPPSPPSTTVQRLRACPPHSGLLLFPLPGQPPVAGLSLGVTSSQSPPSLPSLI